MTPTIKSRLCEGNSENANRADDEEETWQTVVTFLDHWQTLVGSFIGGLMGVIGALIVAGLAVRRQRWVMASALLPDTQQLRAAHDALERALQAIDPPLGEWAQFQWRAERLAQLRPTLAEVIVTLLQPYLPASITVDNGPEFAGKVLDAWAYEAGVTLSFIRKREILRT
ncbi:hypothetical protein [Burkholderia ubonensis]|uniref:hypothetical protein n=1 Tax=Burkholderia ubonensis TaxID=101571 RepID=UPI0012F7BE90|nr:hypothetical protein [Burkholderia ubonensis]